MDQLVDPKIIALAKEQAIKELPDVEKSVIEDFYEAILTRQQLLLENPDLPFVDLQILINERHPLIAEYQIDDNPLKEETTNLLEMIFENLTK